MITPHEFSKTGFRKAFNGYNVSDVNEHLDFTLTKYTELYDAYNELEQKFASLEAELYALKKSEDTIRRAFVNAQNSSSKIIKDANDSASFILRAAQENCDKILLEFRQKIKDERAELFMLKSSVAQFKQKIFAEYQQHLGYLESISPDFSADDDKWNLSDKELVTKAISQIMFDVSEAEKNKEAMENPKAEPSAAKPKEEPSVNSPINDEILEDLVNNKGDFEEKAQSELVPVENDEQDATKVDIPKIPEIKISEEDKKLFEEILG